MKQKTAIRIVEILTVWVWGPFWVFDKLIDVTKGVDIFDWKIRKGKWLRQ